LKAHWDAEIEQVRQALAEFNPRGNVLELASGTGIWSGELARFADALTLVDSSPEAMAINAARVEHPRVRRVHADLEARLSFKRGLGWQAEVRTTPNFVLFGSATPMPWMVEETATRSSAFLAA
jgi:SAM-dependent methyltransferase